MLQVASLSSYESYEPILNMLNLNSTSEPLRVRKVQIGPQLLEPYPGSSGPFAGGLPRTFLFPPALPFLLGARGMPCPVFPHLLFHGPRLTASEIASRTFQFLHCQAERECGVFFRNYLNNYAKIRGPILFSLSCETFNFVLSTSIYLTRFRLFLDSVIEEERVPRGNLLV